MVLFWILLLVLIILTTSGLYFASRILNPAKVDYQHIYQAEFKNGLFDGEAFRELSKQEIWVPSPHGYKLHGYYIPQERSHKTIVISHGIESNLNASIKFVTIFRDFGFNVLIYDLRNHGRSGGRNTTYGYYEKYDLRAMVDWAFMRLGQAGLVGTIGESMGGAISIQHAAIDDRTAFCIAASSFSDFHELLVYRFKYEFKLPVFPFVQLADFMTTLISGLSFSAVSPLRDIKAISLPVMLIHGENDKFVPAQMSRELFNAKVKGIRVLYITPKAGHTDSFSINREEYNNQVCSFLEKIGMLK